MSRKTKNAYKARCRFFGLFMGNYPIGQIIDGRVRTRNFR